MSANKEYKRGASSSIKKTIGEIEAYLKGEGIDTPSGLREELHSKLSKLGKKWYRKGFNRGHKQSYFKFSETSKVPKVLSYKSNRNFFGAKTAIKLTSRIKKK